MAKKKAKEVKMAEAFVPNENPARCRGVAYSGGAVTQWWSNAPIFIDLNGMEFAEQIPLMTDHENEVEERLGEVRCSIVDGKLMLDGEITAAGDKARKIIEDGKKTPWQLSIGARVLTYEELEGPDELRTVNGREVKAPALIVTSSLLREVSVVSIGADTETTLEIAAKDGNSGILQATFELEKGTEETLKAEEKTEEPAEVNAIEAKEETKTEIEAVDNKTETENKKEISAMDKEEIIAAERARVKEIRDICAGEYPEIEAEYIEQGKSADECRTAVLAKLRADRKAAPVQSTTASVNDLKAMEAGLSIRFGASEDSLLKGENKLSEQEVEAGYKLRNLSMQDIVRACLRREGKATGNGAIDDSEIRAGFSTASLPTLLGAIAGRRLLAAYENTPIVARRLCSEGDLANFNEAQRVRLSDLGMPEKVEKGGEIKQGVLGEEAAINKLETYAQNIVIDRQMIINDDLGAFMRLPAAMGAKMAGMIDYLFFSRLLANPTQGDGVALFHASHNNLTTGSSSALGVNSLKAAIGKFEKQTAPDGRPIGSSPRFLLVPSELKFLAIELCRAAGIVVAGATDTVQANFNSVVDLGLEVVASPWLSNATLAGNSSTAWYLFGAPERDDTFEIGYLRGNRTPMVRQGETDYQRLGMWFQVYFDVGVRELGYRGMQKVTAA